MSRLFTRAPFDLASRIPAASARKSEPALRPIPENDLVRHHVNLSRKNYCVDSAFYPLGSCTMKYSPKISEIAAAETGFSDAHPWQADSDVQGILRIYDELARDLANVTGLTGVSLFPAAGAHGELCALKTARKYFEARGEASRTEVLVPENAHGTNPASAAMCGCTVRVVKITPSGRTDLDDLRSKLSNCTAVLMLTNPSTLGLFESDIVKIAEMVHGAGGLLYYDGANLNAILGRVRPGDMGFDMVHMNLHKTFSIPHGAGGPGAGPIAVRDFLGPHLPGPFLKKDSSGYRWIDGGAASMGRFHGSYGNFLNLFKGWMYLRLLGDEGARQVSLAAVLNANYLQEKIKPLLDVPYGAGRCMHEFVASAAKLKERTGVSAMDIAKRLLDEGMYAPTVYFPLLVKEALMIEPTETETLETLDRFVEVMKIILAEAESAPEKLKRAPVLTPVRRVDDVTAARKPCVK